MDWISTKLLTVRQDLMVDQREHMYIERAYLLRDNIILIVTSKSLFSRLLIL